MKRATFRQADLTRALKAAKNAGVPISRIEIDGDGKIVIIAGTADAPDARNDVDRWLATHAHSPQGNSLKP